MIKVVFWVLLMPCTLFELKSNFVSMFIFLRSMISDKKLMTQHECLISFVSMFGEEIDDPTRARRQGRRD